MFASLLIANRGEIACRIIRTARRLGLRTVAVYSDADGEAQHVKLADAAYRLGPAPAAESYLHQAAILDAVRRSGAEAVHPGYGFLAENAEFAEAIAAAGAVFVGPPPAAIRAMGSKAAAKATMDRAGVPLVPGYHGDDQDPERLAEEAGRIGYPVLLKASAGGGGKGMRVVERAAEFADALAGAKRESRAAFGDDRMLIEKYLQQPRHIEVQVFADDHGHALHLFERDCSLQRRHQKVIEEAPAPGITAAQRAEMGAAAVRAAAAIGYRGAGTVEFIAEGGAFYFMEMNTRLQVEHPVTEAITGLDLVEWQLRVASGEPLPWGQDDLAPDGHAMEVRLYAEDPAKDFLPATGTLRHLTLPEGMPGVRVDAGVAAGDAVTPHYDPIIAKIIAHGPDRDSALRRLRHALDATRVGGVTTNLGFLCRLLDAPDIRAGRLDTGFIGRHRARLVPDVAELPDDVPAVAALAEIEARREAAAAEALASGDPYSPWHRVEGWRLNEESHRDLVFDGDGTEFRVRAHVDIAGDSVRLDLPSGSVTARARQANDGTLVAEIGGRRLRAVVLRDGDSRQILLGPDSYRLRRRQPLGGAEAVDELGGAMTAPMPGKITHVAVAEGASVAAGATLVVLEAMKMEHSIVAPTDGRIAALRCRVGDQVAEGAELLVFEVVEAPPASGEAAS